jgi:hypothetical protein
VDLAIHRLILLLHSQRKAPVNRAEKQSVAVMENHASNTPLQPALTASDARGVKEEPTGVDSKTLQVEEERYFLVYIDGDPVAELFSQSKAISTQ